MKKEFECWHRCEEVVIELEAGAEEEAEQEGLLQLLLLVFGRLSNSRMKNITSSGTCSTGLLQLQNHLVVSQQLENGDERKQKGASPYFLHCLHCIFLILGLFYFQAFPVISRHKYMHMYTHTQPHTHAYIHPSRPSLFLSFLRSGQKKEKHNSFDHSLLNSVGLET